jgi:hypothetical protein
LNLKTLDSKYSIRCIDQCLKEVGKAGSKIFSCLDMQNGFWNEVLWETDRHFMAFTILGIGQWGRFINKKRGEKNKNRGERQKNSENQVTLDSIFGASKKHYLSNFVLYML